MIGRQTVQPVLLALGPVAAAASGAAAQAAIEKRAGRWIRQVNRLEVRQAK